MARSGGEGCPNLWKSLHNSICLIWDRNTIPRSRLQVRRPRTAPPPSNVDKTLVALMGPLAQGLGLVVPLPVRATRERDMGKSPLQAD